MRNKENWKSSKYERHKGRLRGSRDQAQVGVQSRLTADLVAGFYDAMLPLHARGRLIDLGCGKVPLYGTYAPFIAENICVDWEHSAHRNEFLDATVDLNAPLPFQPGEFDTIILSDVLEHIKDPALLWREMARILRPGGKLLMNVPFYYWLHEEPYDYFRYTKYALRTMAEDAGFEVIALQAMGGAPEVLADVFAKTVVKLPVIGRMAALFVQGLTRLFVRTGIGGRVSRVTSAQFPLLYGLVAVRR
ncbi:MAG: methyltransferase domain-containing protein [Flavobacteriales bacterium]|nr:methyltransferase domain-containing protein [Flavobacteriales bacterium]MCB9194040.1 methyltransferase domain-containing protein [Flavobacteriales bacterium]